MSWNSHASTRGHDADRIRERPSFGGIEPVIQPIGTRSRKIPLNEALHRRSHRIERRIATRHDKLAKGFFAALHLATFFVLDRNS